MEDIEICKHCNKPEYWGKMMWLNGKCMCRNCYKIMYEEIHKTPYKFHDLDEARPTLSDYEKSIK